MALHPKLERYKSEKYIKRFSKTLKAVDRELQAVGRAEWVVEILMYEDPYMWKHIIPFIPLDDIEKTVMIVQGTVGGRPFTFENPMALGLLLPYTLRITLDTKVDARYMFRRSGFGGIWSSEPGRPEHIAAIERLSLPTVRFRHSWGGGVSMIHLGHEILPDDSNPSHVSWVIRSGYQGFVFNVGPRVAKYIQAAPGLEEVLRKSDKGAAGCRSG